MGLPEIAASELKPKRRSIVNYSNDTMTEVVLLK